MFVGRRPVRRPWGRRSGRDTHILPYRCVECDDGGVYISMTHVGVRLGVGVGVYVCVIRGTVEAAS